MAFRDDLEAARERVVALERDLTNARARKQSDRLRVMELMRTIDAEWRLDHPPPQEVPRPPRNPIAIAITTLFCIGIGIASLLSHSSSPENGGSRYAIDLKDSLRKRVPPDARIVSIDAGLVDRSGRMHVHPGRPLGVEYVSAKTCERVEWRAESGLFIHRTPLACAEVPVPEIRCSPYEIRLRLAARNLDVGDYASLQWHNGIWTARRWTGGPFFTLYDDCDRRFWP
jgi:hypothetical protein